jgi:hypothetical protein
MAVSTAIQYIRNAEHVQADTDGVFRFAPIALRAEAVSRGREARRVSEKRGQSGVHRCFNLLFFRVAFLILLYIRVLHRMESIQ